MTTLLSRRLLAIALAVGLIACNESGERPPAPAAVPVAASTPTAPSVPTRPSVTPPKSQPAADTSRHTVLAGAATTVGSLFDLETPFEDQDSKPLALSSLRGDPVIISMFYSRCAYACPTLISDVRAIVQALEPAVRDRIRVLLVSFDFGHDTPEVLRGLVKQYGTSDRWTFARARDDEGTRELAGALGIKYRAVGGGDFNHSSIITLLATDGVPLARIDGLAQDATAFLAVAATAASSDPSSHR